jgi:hypothetical protein
MTGTVISQSLVITAGADGINADNPIIGYQNLVDATNIAATSAQAGFPVGNLANPATHLLWKALGPTPIADQYLTVILDTPEEVDYLAVATHNFGSGLIIVSVEGNPLDPIANPGSWFELVSDHLLTTDGPIIFRFAPQSLFAVRLRIQPSQAVPALLPQAAVMYVGKLLILQRRIYVGHTPMPYGRSLQVANLMSISGAFLGRIVLGGKRRTGVNLQNISASWYRTYLDPFLIAAQEIPFFFAWRPGTYPEEAGFAWLTEDPEVSNMRANGMMQVSFRMEGVV